MTFARIFALTLGTGTFSSDPKSAQLGRRDYYICGPKTPQEGVVVSLTFNHVLNGQAVADYLRLNLKLLPIRA
jgi:hypothetical protein